MSREFKKSEQHALAKHLHAALLAATQIVLSRSAHEEKVLGVNFKWSSPEADVARQTFGMFTKDRVVVVYVTKNKKQVAYSRK